MKGITPTTSLCTIHMTCVHVISQRELASAVIHKQLIGKSLALSKKHSSWSPICEWQMNITQWVRWCRHTPCFVLIRPTYRPHIPSGHPPGGNKHFPFSLMTILSFLGECIVCYIVIFLCKLYYSGFYTNKITSFIQIFYSLRGKSLNVQFS